MSRTYKILIGIVFVFILLYNSIYIEKLSSRESEISNKNNFIEKSENIYQKLIEKDAPTLEEMKLAFKTDKEAAFLRYGNRLGIGSTAYFLCENTASIIEINADELRLKSEQGELFKISLQFVFGNAIRDASKQVKLTDYKKTSDFNQLSESLNDLIRDKMIPKDLESLKIGDSVKIIGVFKHSKFKEISNYPQIIPIKISKL